MSRAAKIDNFHLINEIVFSSSPSKKFSFKHTLMLERILNTSLYYSKNESKLRRKHFLCSKQNDVKYFLSAFYFQKHILSLLVVLKKYLFLKNY
jgi:hypothetical protein